MQALRGAQRLITPHAEAARHLRFITATRVDLIDWCQPGRTDVDVPSAPHTRPTVVFPASALPRKGALEMAEAMRTLGWRLMALGTPSTDAQLWKGIEVEHTAYRDPRWLTCADVVALPAHVEHAPRALLTAIAHGVPVVATAACGLPAGACATEVVAGDIPGLVRALRHAVSA